MRWSVEVTSGEKTDLQKYVVDAESWQRALQAARAQRGEQGPMSGFSIELLDEGYRAVDPVSRNKFVVKRAPDDAPLTAPAAAAATAAPSKDSKAPAAPRTMKAPAPLPSKTSVPPTAGKSIPPAAGKSIPPAAKTTPSVPPVAAKSTPSMPPAAKSTPSVPPAAKSTPSVPPRPGDKKDDKKSDASSPGKKSRAERKSEKMKAAAAKKAEERHKSAVPPPVIEPEEEVPATDAQPEPPRPPADSIQETPLLPVGAFVPGLPSVKLMTSREQDPSDASPLAYREYAFSTKEGTNEEVAEKILRAQLKLVQAHMAKLKQGKLVNLAVFDGTFEGKPTVPPLCTLAWKDWKGEPVIAFPRRSGATKQVKPPTAPTASGSHAPMMPPASMPPNPPPTPAAPVVNMPPGYSAPPPAASTTQPIQPSAVPRPPGAIAAMLNAAKSGAEAEPPAPEAPANPLNQTVKDAVNPFAMSPSAAPPGNNPFAPTASAPPPANPFAPTPSAAPQGAPVGPGTSPMIPVAAPVAAPSAPPPPAPSVPPPAAASFPPPAMGSVHPPATFQPQPPVPITTAPAQPSSPPPRRASTPDGVVRTPSGRFVRGRVTGDELITELFESMHDLHFLRDALDGGQFCLALAMEMIPVRAAIIHFFDVEKREWIVACTRGKDAGKLLTTRTPETDDLLRAAARHRRAIVTPNGAHAQAQRYQSIGGARSIIIAPIMQAGRALGAMEMINPADGMPFNEDEGNAMTYIAEQYAEYLGSRGIVVHPDRIRAAANV